MAISRPMAAHRYFRNVLSFSHTLSCLLQAGRHSPPFPSFPIRPRTHDREFAVVGYCLLALRYSCRACFTTLFSATAGSSSMRRAFSMEGLLANAMKLAH